MVPMDQKDFRPTHIYYKSTDLDYKTRAKTTKSGHKTTDWLAAPSNKLYIGHGNTQDGPKGPPGPERLQANTHLLTNPLTWTTRH